MEIKEASELYLKVKEASELYRKAIFDQEIKKVFAAIKTAINECKRDFRYEVSENINPNDIVDFLCKCKYKAHHITGGRYILISGWADY